MADWNSTHFYSNATSTGTGTGDTQWLWANSYGSIPEAEAVKRMREAQATAVRLEREKSDALKEVYRLQQELASARKANEIIGERKGFKVPGTLDAADAILDKFAAFRCLADKACHEDDGELIHSIRCIEHNG